MAGHLTLEEREIIAHEHRAEKCRRRSPTGSAAAKTRFPANCNAIAAATAIGRWQTRERLGGGGVNVRGSPRCNSQKCGVMSGIACGGDGRPTRSPVAQGGFPGDRRQWISPPTIYAWIGGEEATGKHWRRYLRRLGRQRPNWEKRGRIRTGTSIEGRPVVVDRRRRFGDWEGDTIVGVQPTRRRRHAGRAEVGLFVAGQGSHLAGGDGPSDRRRVVSDHASEAAEDADAGQRQGVRRARAVDGGSRFEDLLCEAVLRKWQRGAKRKHQRPGPAVLSQRYGSGRHPQSSFYQSPTTSQRPSEKTLGYRTPNEVLASRLKVAIRLDSGCSVMPQKTHLNGANQPCSYPRILLTNHKNVAGGVARE